MFIILGRFRVQFGITKHELIFQRLPKFVVWKNLQVLIYSKFHEKNDVMTY